jgi:hypothetical protein
MEQESIDELKQFEEEVASAMAQNQDEPETEVEPEPNVDDCHVDWKKKYDTGKLKRTQN